MADIAKRDENRVPTLLAVSSADGISPVKLYADPVTHRLYTDASSTSSSLTPVATKTANYTANANETVPCNISAGSFAVTLPTAPADGTRVRVQLLTVGTDKNLEVKTGGSDKFFVTSVGPTSLYMYIYGETQEFQYQASGAFWNGIAMAPTSNFANNFPGIDAITPITNDNISIDTTARTLTVTPPLGFFNIYTDGGGKTTKHRKTTVVFGNGSGTSGNNTWTDTSGMWYFYLDINGQPVTTQTPWTTTDFPSISTVYRVLWNSSLSGANKKVAEYIEYHVNDIDADTHQWFHLQGTQWVKGGTMVNNALVSGAPNADGRNSVIGLTTISNVDDNLEYTVTNSTGGLAWQQDLGNTTAASLNATNSALFSVFTQDGSANVSFLPATRFPFDWNSSTNVPQYITSTGTRTAVTNQNFMVTFVYATQNPLNGQSLKIVSATTDFSSITNARAYNWIDIQNTYSIFANDPEIRPLYRLIFEVHTSTPNTYDVGAKYSVLRETQDLRKAATTSTTAATGSLPASSVTNVPAGNIASTNVQSALNELDTEKLALAGGTMTGDILGAISYGSTGTRVTKVWATDIETTNAPTVGGVAVPTISSTSTLTNKRINPRLVTAASYTTDTGTSLDVSTCDQFEITAQAGALKFNNPSGTPLGGQKLIIRIKDNGTARALTYDTQFRAMGNALPSTTVLSKTLYMGLIYNATDTKWDLVAVAQEA